MQASLSSRARGFDIRRGDLIALGIALAAHLALLSVPLRHWQTGDQAARAIAVSLLARSPATPTQRPPEPDRIRESPSPPAPAPRPFDSDRPAPEPAPESTTGATPNELPQPPPLQQPESNISDDAPRTIARLLDQLHGNPFAPQASDTERTLGVYAPSPPPRNWRSGQTVEWRRSGGRPLPRKVEILDRWHAADGSHNVIVETPEGDLLCGRAEAWNPMSPLIEPVMMFRTCGQGNPTFEMERPYRER